MFVKSNNSNKPKMFYALHAEQYDPDVFNRSPHMHAHVRQIRSTVAREKLTTLVSGLLYDRIASVCCYKYYVSSLLLNTYNGEHERLFVRWYKRQRCSYTIRLPFSIIKQ